MVGESLYFKSKMLVSNGVYVVTDRLGSVRANTQGGTFAYYPYGEERTTNPNGLDKFATYFRDAAGQDYADQRYYNAGNGRFWSADPTAGSTANPASLNRYAYVRGDPVNLSDPTGRDPICGPGGVWMGEGCYNTGTGAPGDCWEEFGAEGCEDDTGGGGGGDTDGGGGGGGGGCGSSMGSGFWEPPDPNPTSCTVDTPPPSTPSCPPQYQAYINAYGADATTAKLPEANTLALTAIESAWGNGPFVINGGNDFFNLEAVWKPGTPQPGNKYAYQLGWRQAGEKITSGGLKGYFALVATYSSALDSFMSAAATFSNLTATDPATFAKNAVADGINAGRSPDFLKMEKIFANCLGGQ